MPNTEIAMNSVHARLVSQASAVRSLNRQVAGALGTAALASILVSRIGPIGSHAGTPTPAVVAGYNDLFLVASRSRSAHSSAPSFSPGGPVLGPSRRRAAAIRAKRRDGSELVRRCASARRPLVVEVVILLIEDFASGTPIIPR
jgi:hypothetical protein